MIFYLKERKMLIFCVLRVNKIVTTFSFQHQGKNVKYSKLPNIMMIAGKKQGSLYSKIFL